MIAFGMKGAALAALGEIATGAFFRTAAAVAPPFGDKKDGVKLGESTLSVFLGWLLNRVREPHANQRNWVKLFSDYLSICPLSEEAFSMAWLKAHPAPPSQLECTAPIALNRKVYTFVFIAALSVDCDIATEGVLSVLCHSTISDSTLLLSDQPRTSALQLRGQSSLLCIFCIILNHCRHSRYWQR